MEMGKSKTDNALIARCRNGDKTAFDQLVTEHGTAVYNFIHFMVKNRSLADDVYFDGKFTADSKINLQITPEPDRKNQGCGNITGRIVDKNNKSVDGRIDMIKKVVQRCSLRNIFTLPDGRFIVIVEDGGKNFRAAKDYSGKRLIIDLFTKDGYFLKSYDWNWKQNGFIAHIDALGYFYTSIGDSEPVPGVTKWRVSFE